MRVIIWKGAGVDGKGDHDAWKFMLSLTRVTSGWPKWKLCWGCEQGKGDVRLGAPNSL